jgi:hypothetical protein
MTTVLRRLFFLAVIVLSLGACSSGPQKQWYKPGGNYTMAEFDRDEKACMKDSRLDEACMKERGWIAISADEDKGPPPMQGGPPPGRPSYAPK